MSRRVRIGTFGAGAAEGDWLGTVTGVPQLLHVAVRPANSAGTENGLPQPVHLNWIIP
jgi:hypothetical protein